LLGKKKGQRRGLGFPFWDVEKRMAAPPLLPPGRRRQKKEEKKMMVSFPLHTAHGNIAKKRGGPPCGVLTLSLYFPGEEKKKKTEEEEQYRY